MMLRCVTLVAALAASTDAFSVPSLVPKVGSAPLISRAHPLRSESIGASVVLGASQYNKRMTSPKVTMSLASSAGSVLFSTQAASVEKLKAARALEPKDYPAEMGFDSFSIGDAQGTLTAYEAPGKFNVAWCSSLNVASANMCMSSLTNWCGPLYDVPHLCARTVVTDSSVDLFIDFRPRAYAAYETRLDDGTYGEPTSREWFSHKGARDGFAQAFFTPGVESWADAIRCQGTAKGKPTGDELLYRGPITIDVTLPANDASVALAAKACAEAHDIWMSWMDSTEPLPAGMRVTSTYAYDTKMRAQLFGVLAGTYTKLFGEKGRSLAAADAGPLDEAYVGGAS